MASSKKSVPEDEDEDEEEEDEEEEKQQKRPASAPVNLSEPLFFWVIVLILALFSMVVTADTKAFAVGSAMYEFLHGASNFFLFGTGTLILPLIVGAVIGAEVGTKARSIVSALKSGLLNGVYAGIVYVIAIVIIYEVLVYVLPSSGVTLSFLENNLVIPQVIIVIVLVEVFAVLTHGRKVGV